MASRAAQASVLLCETELTTVVRAAWLHDLGHSPEITELGFHPLDGARYLAARGEDPVECQLVAYHSGAMVEAEVPATRVRLPRSSQPLTRCCCRC